MPLFSSYKVAGDSPDGECRDRPPEPVIRRERPVIPVPVLPRRRHEVREPVQKLKRRQFDHAIGSRPRGLPLASRADPVGGFVPEEHVADFGCAAARITSHKESLRTRSVSVTRWT